MPAEAGTGFQGVGRHAGPDVPMVQGRLIVSAMGRVVQAVTRDTDSYPKRYADRLVVEDTGGNRAGVQTRDTPGQQG